MGLLSVLQITKWRRTPVNAEGSEEGSALGAAAGAVGEGEDGAGAAGPGEENLKTRSGCQ